MFEDFVCLFFPCSHPTVPGPSLSHLILLYVFVKLSLHIRNFHYKHICIYIYVYLYVYRYVNIWEYYGFYFKENHGEYPCICLLIHVIRVLGAGCFSNGKSRRLLYRKMVWQNKIYSVSHMVKRNIFHGNAYTHKHIYHMHICVLYIVR